MGVSIEKWKTGLYIRKYKKDGEYFINAHMGFDLEDFTEELKENSEIFEFVFFLENPYKFFAEGKVEDCHGFGSKEAIEEYNTVSEFKERVDEEIDKLSKLRGEEVEVKETTYTKALMSGLLVRKFKDRDACVFVEKAFDVNAFQRFLEKEKDIQADFLLFLPNPCEFFITGRTKEHYYGFGYLEAIEEYNTNPEFEEIVDDRIRELAELEKEEENKRVLKAEPSESEEEVLEKELEPYHEFFKKELCKVEVKNVARLKGYCEFLKNNWELTHKLKAKDFDVMLSKLNPLMEDLRKSNISTWKVLIPLIAIFERLKVDRVLSKVSLDLLEAFDDPIAGSKEELTIEI